MIKRLYLDNIFCPMCDKMVQTYYREYGDGRFVSMVKWGIESRLYREIYMRNIVEPILIDSMIKEYSDNIF